MKIFNSFLETILKPIRITDKKKNMEREITLTLADLRQIFIAGEEFERESIEFNLGERDDIEAPDFGDFMEQKFGIKI